MQIYKVIAEFGLDQELDPFICATMEAAERLAQQWLALDDCDAVTIATETPDYESGMFETITHKRITKKL